MPPGHRLARAVSRINIRRTHDLTRTAARERVDHVAAFLGKRFDARCEWKGDTLAVTHPQVNGSITLGEREVVVEAKLGFVLAMFRDRIDEELVNALDREFPEAKA
jgi:putative polyhydroxyalkanoate system protein